MDLATSGVAMEVTTIFAWGEVKGVSQAESHHYILCVANGYSNITICFEMRDQLLLRIIL
jgi:hypothetical protein